MSPHELPPDVTEQMEAQGLLADSTLHALDPDSADLTGIWVRLYTYPDEHQRADYLRDDVLTVNRDLLKEARRWIATGRPDDVRTFGRSFGTFYGLPWHRDPDGQIEEPA